MKLRTVHEHFTKRGTKWVPKRGFNNVSEISTLVGFDPDKCLTYKCSYCGYLHMYSPSWKKKKR